MTRSDWESLNGHKGAVLWFTGLSGAGKTTLARNVEEELIKQGIRSVVIDGDQLRQGLNADLGFSEEDRKENMRRAAEVSTMFLNQGFVVLVSMISPSSEAREEIRRRFSPGDYAEIYVKCSIEACEKRDPKGLYQKVRKGEIRGFTGIDAIYEPPVFAELTVNTEDNDLECCVSKLMDYIIHNYTLLANKGGSL